MDFVWTIFKSNNEPFINAYAHWTFFQVVGIGAVAKLHQWSIAYAFLDRVLNRFGAPSKVFIDQGMKFRGEFQELCEKALIDHHTASWDHLEADGLVEQMVHIMKRGLWKYGLQKGHTWDWDLQLSWLTTRYRFSP